MSETVQIETKFDTCKHRSAGPVKKLVKRCACRGGDRAWRGGRPDGRPGMTTSCHVPQQPSA